MSKGTIADPRPLCYCKSTEQKAGYKGHTDQSEASAQHRAVGGHGNRRRPARPGWERDGPTRKQHPCHHRHHR